ncbi:hypothetical protein [Maribacter sedimenticola]|nr:hypothetical protein [Maribacter sedimenticola]
MKTIMIKYAISTIAVTLIMASCSSSKQTVATDPGSSTSTTEVTTNTAKTQAPEVPTDMENTDNTPGHLNVSPAAQANGSTGAMNNQLAKSSSTESLENDKTLFATLGMTKDQINTYNAAMDRFKKQQKNMASGEMMGSIDSERKRQLEEILTTEQYDMYKKLAKSGN